MSTWEKTVLEPKSDTLARIRSDSCYKVSRFLVTCVTIFVVIPCLCGSAVFWIWTVRAWNANLDILGWEVHWYQPAIAAMISMLTALSCLKDREAHLLRFDLADSLIELNRKKLGPGGWE